MDNLDREADELEALERASAGRGGAGAVKILEEVRAERARQDEKWGDQQKHPLSLWGLILTEEVGEFSAAVLEGDSALARRELVQVAAVAVAVIESLDAEALVAAVRKKKEARVKYLLAASRLRGEEAEEAALAIYDAERAEDDALGALEASARREGWEG